MTESPDRFDPTPQQKTKQGKSTSKRIALLVFLIAGAVFLLVAVSILNSDGKLKGSKAPENLFMGSKQNADSIPIPKPLPPEPEPEPLAEPTPTPTPKARTVYVPVPRVSELRKKEQLKRILAAEAPTAIQGFRADGTAGTASGSTGSGGVDSTLEEVAKLLSGVPVPAAAAQGADGGQGYGPPSFRGAGNRNNDPNGWGHKEDFVNRKDLPEEYSQHTRTPQRSLFELKSGTLLPCVLISGLNSDLPGNLVGQVTENVWDTATGRYILIPRGSKVIGTYDNQISYGQSRVLIVWSRIIFPDGSTLSLDRLGGMDQSGYSGFKGKVNRHWNSILTSALMVSLLGAGVEMAAPTKNGDRDREDHRSILAENAAAAIAEASAQIIGREVHRQPTIKIRPGYRFLVFLQRDILFPAAWR